MPSFSPKVTFLTLRFSETAPGGTYCLLIGKRRPFLRQISFCIHAVAAGSSVASMTSGSGGPGYTRTAVSCLSRHRTVRNGSFTRLPALESVPSDGYCTIGFLFLRRTKIAWVLTPIYGYDIRFGDLGLQIVRLITDLFKSFFGFFDLFK
jgi:hypothetical protein